MEIEYEEPTEEQIEKLLGSGVNINFNNDSYETTIKAYRLGLPVVNSPQMSSFAVKLMRLSETMSQKVSGKGVISGNKRMGSCRCGDIDWKIEYDTETMEFSYETSNPYFMPVLANRKQFQLPYAGNMLERLIEHTGIVLGWKYIPSKNELIYQERFSKFDY